MCLNQFGVHTAEGNRGNLSLGNNLIDIAVVAFAIYKILSTPPQFSTTGTILVRSEGSHFGNSMLGDEFSMASELMNMGKLVDDEMIVLQSKTIMKQMIDELMLQTSAFYKKRLGGYYELYNNEPLVVIYPDGYKKNIKGSLTIKVKKTKDNIWKFKFTEKIAYKKTKFKSELNDLNQFILEKSVFGTPIFKLGNGGKKILLLSGIHGNELPPQLANLKLINELIHEKLNNTLFFIPFAVPQATMDNERVFNMMDLNRSAHIKNSISNLIVQKACRLGIDFAGDFHSTAYNSNPGFESVFSSKSPSSESFLIANYISQDVGSEIISFDFAGSSYKGAVEDVFNLREIPAVTCEVVSPFCRVSNGSVDKSFAQMKSFLSYFGI